MKHQWVSLHSKASADGVRCWVLGVKFIQHCQSGLNPLIEQ